MLHRSVIAGLFTLLVWHTMAFVVVSGVAWWHAENELSEQLVVYRSVDSLVEFQLLGKPVADGGTLSRTTEDGFRYRGHYYNVISQTIRGDTLTITSLELPSHSFWQKDLLAFLEHLKAASNTDHKAHQLLKFFLKEYTPTTRFAFDFTRQSWSQQARIADGLFTLPTRWIAVQSPPPQGVAGW